MTSAAWGFGLATIAPNDTVLDVWFPEPALGEGPQHGAAPAGLDALAGDDELRGVRREVVRVDIPDLDAAPASTQDVWLRLHLLSARLVTPHSISLDGVFALLTNVVWTSAGPCAVEGFELTRARMRALSQRGRYALGNTQMMRVTMTTPHSAAAPPISSVQGWSCNASTTSGSCKPISMNTAPLSRKINVCQNAVAVSRVEADSSSELRAPIHKPATTVASTPETCKRSATR